MTIGVLALQGDFEAHAKALGELGVKTIEVRTTADLDSVDGLILPGGESSTMLKLLRIENLFEPLRAFAARKPVFGTCAGAILLASQVSNPAQESLGLMDMTVERNAYGRQLDSRIVPLDGVAGEAVFIRAPIIRQVGPPVRVLARYQGDPVLVEQDHLMAATFHPELAQNRAVHELFLRKIPAG